MPGFIGKTISHYKILERLGEGGMGMVYRAEDVRLGRTVAIKVLKGSSTRGKESRQRFISEAHNASTLQHINICTIHEIEETSRGQLFIAMDFYEGETLKKRLTGEVIGTDEVVEIALQIAGGLKKAHENGIIHRDIKPANIYITKDGIVKILDFGLAKRRDQTQFTKAHVRFGTTEYMSPEQIRGEDVDGRSDIWSLGIILYEMLTGRLPFEAEYEQAMVYLILNQEPEDIRVYRKEVPELLLTAVKRSLSKDRDDRYDDITALIDELRNVTSQEKVQRPVWELPPLTPSHSVAVLPFVNIDADPDQEAFCDGLTEELIGALSRIQSLKVVSRSSAFALKHGGMDVRKAGRRLNVRAVLQGSVRRSGNRIRITAQLVNVADGYHLWSERYDREQEDILAIQDDISLAIVDVLKVKILGEERDILLKRYTENIEAYNLYHRGTYFFNQFNFALFNKAIQYFKEALEKDPTYAIAYHGLAGCYFCLAYFGVRKTQEVRPEMMEYVRKALEIDPNLSEGYEVLALMNACFEWKWTEAQSAWQRSLELCPTNVMSLLSFSINRSTFRDFRLARELVKRAQSIDPLYDYGEFCASLPDFCSRQFGAVIARLEKYLNLDPPFWWGLWTLWRALSLAGRTVESVEACKRAFSLTGRGEIGQLMETAGVHDAFRVAACALADVYQHGYTSPYDIATLFVHAGRVEEALHWLGRSIEDIDPRLHFLNVDPEWQILRNDQRFISCLRTIGFVP